VLRSITCVTSGVSSTNGEEEETIRDTSTKGVEIIIIGRILYCTRSPN